MLDSREPSDPYRHLCVVRLSVFRSSKKKKRFELISILNSFINATRENVMQYFDQRVVSSKRPIGGRRIDPRHASRVALPAFHHAASHGTPVRHRANFKRQVSSHSCSGLASFSLSPSPALPYPRDCGRRRDLFPHVSLLLGCSVIDQRIESSVFLFLVMWLARKVMVFGE
ncbi:hypothetical protein NPIL_443851 [Nephila pilipes]|uniref:Uncharacterized protein n=1 Tax=Nephila pilipes TaxID=299642 RepID=A0A8X6T7C9_NEPPI|nr:hypothetical protein NPIL_443851 [Nephila pilipes]